MSTQTTELSNRQKFKQIQPPIKLYEKLEKLGFGTLLRTKRFSGLHKQKQQRQEQKAKFTERVGPPPEPKYNVSFSFCSYGQVTEILVVVSFAFFLCRRQSTYIDST